MDIETLTKKFIVTDDWIRDHLEAITTQLLRHCVIDKLGTVHVKNRNLTAKQRVMLVLAARTVASRLDPDISGTVTVSEIARATGLAENQVRARGNDWVVAKFAESPKRGAFRAVQPRIEDFLNGLIEEANDDDE
jgi:hypothetical protein